MASTRRGQARAHPNIALVKYWGKRDRRLNLPAAGSVSVTLAPIHTRTEVELGVSASSVVLDGAEVGGRAGARVLDFVAMMLEEARWAGETSVRVVSSNDFPTAAGLASSASAFAALALAVADAIDWSPGVERLSELARRGSGSAARSVLGGYVEMRPGQRADGRDAFAVPIVGAAHWDLRCAIALTMTGSKSVSSTAAMNATEATSPYYGPWVDGVAADVEMAREAILARDFEALAIVSERSCLRMHAAALAADPGVLFWNGATVAAIHEVRALRGKGTAAFFTIDAGPHVKVFAPADEIDGVRRALADVAGVLDVLTVYPGPPARRGSGA